jgi:hypothetical protein
MEGVVLINISGEYNFSSSRGNVSTHLFDPEFLVDTIHGSHAVVLEDNQEDYGKI